nr:MAG TPA: hypothetical protein [Caudoviricetes sp.]
MHEESILSMRIGFFNLESEYQKVWCIYKVERVS